MSSFQLHKLHERADSQLLGTVGSRVAKAPLPQVLPAAGMATDLPPSTQTQVRLTQLPHKYPDLNKTGHQADAGSLSPASVHVDNHSWGCMECRRSARLTLTSKEG